MTAAAEDLRSFVIREIGTLWRFEWFSAKLRWSEGATVDDTVQE
jgi:hypothetical protein